MTTLEIVLVIAVVVLWLLGGFMCANYARDAEQPEPGWAIVTWPIWALVILVLKLRATIRFFWLIFRSVK